MEIAERSDRTKFRDQVLKPLLNEGLLNMSTPEKPTSSNHEYRLTEKGQTILEVLEKESKEKWLVSCNS